MLWLLPALGSAAITAYAAYKKGEMAEDEYQRAVEANRALEAKLRSMRPDETWQDINPQLLSETAKYSPDIAAFVQENAPELIQEAQSATEKNVQRQALQKLAAQSETGRDVVSEAQREQALYEADARSKQRQQALMQRMRQQGMLGSGAALAAQLQSEQATAQEARQASLQGVQESEARRRQALGQAAELAGQMRGQNLKVESANVETMNAFNQRLANARNLYNQYASTEKNKAQLENQQRELARQQYNLGLTNKYTMYNREQRNLAKERAREFDVNLVKQMHGVTRDAESDRNKARRQLYGDYATALSTGIGVGANMYALDKKFNTPSSTASVYNPISATSQSELDDYEEFVKSGGTMY